MRPVYEALLYASMGWPVFPCHPTHKRPLIKEGFKAATTDPEKIRKWWLNWPEAMIGAPTGPKSIGGIGAMIIDLDLGDPKLIEGTDYLKRFIRLIEDVPHSAIARTGSGGIHLYFEMSDELAPVRMIRAVSALEIKPKPGALAKDGGRAKGAGVDVLAGEGYTILPPSKRTDGATYEWLQPLKDLAPPSERILSILRGELREKPKAPERTAAPPVTADDRIRKYALSAFDKEIRELGAAPEGTRNEHLNRASFALGQLVAAGALDLNMVRAALFNVAAAWPNRKKSQGTIESGLRGGMAQPRDLSEVARGAARPAAPEGQSSGSSRSARGGADTSGGGGGAPPERGSPGGEGGGGDIDPEILAACAREPQNDIGNARRLRMHFGADMLNVREVGPHAWARTHWEAEGAGEAFQRFAQATAERIALETPFLDFTKEEARAIAAFDELMPAPDPEKREPARLAIEAAAGAAKASRSKRRGDRRKYSISSGNTARLTGMIAQALPHITVAPEALDADPLAINVLNGTLRIVKEKIEDLECPDPDEKRYITRWRVRLDPHDRADRIAKVLPVTYDPKARYPKWLKFLVRFQPNRRVRRFLQRFHGYALTGMMGEQVFLYNYGLGANGKSTFMEAIARLMGAYAQVLPAEALTGDIQRRGDQATPEFARLPGARLVRCAELPRGQGFREATLKMLTGGEPILVRHLHARFFEFRPAFKAIGSGNDRPNIGGVDEGIWRRVKLVPWQVTIPPSERRPMEKVLDEFKAEGSGILNWLLIGLIAYLETGLKPPAEIDAATESYRDDMDPVGEFAKACVVPVAGASVTARAMYEAYTAWAHANSVKPFAERTFAVIMTQKGFAKENGRIRKYLNVALQDVPNDPDSHDPERHRDDTSGARDMPF